MQQSLVNDRGFVVVVVAVLRHLSVAVLALLRQQNVWLDDTMGLILHERMILVVLVVPVVQDNVDVVVVAVTAKATISKNTMVML